eukprot:3310588-Prymnesium_polylepis.1
MDGLNFLNFTKRGIPAVSAAQDAHAPHLGGRSLKMDGRRKVSGRGGGRGKGGGDGRHGG